MRALSVIGVIWSSGVHWRATWCWLGKFVVTLLRHGCRWVPSRRLWWCWFILVVGVSRTPWVSLGSCGVVLFTRARLGGRWVHPGLLRTIRACAGCRSGHPVSLGSIARAQGVCWVHPLSFGSLARTLVIVGFIRGSWVHLRAPWWLFCSLAHALGVVGFIGETLGSVARSGGCWVHPRLVGSLARAQVVVGFIVVRWVHSRAHWWLFCSLGHALGVVGFIGGRWVQSRAL